MRFSQNKRLPYLLTITAQCWTPCCTCIITQSGVDQTIQFQGYFDIHTVYSENVSDNFERLLTRVAVGVDFLRLCHFGVAAILLLGFVVFCDSALIRFVTLRVMTNVANWVLSLYRLGERANKLTLFTLHDNWTIFCQFAAEEQKSVTALTACLHYTYILSFFHTSIFRDITQNVAGKRDTTRNISCSVSFKSFSSTDHYFLYLRNFDYFLDSGHFFSSRYYFFFSHFSYL